VTIIDAKIQGFDALKNQAFRRFERFQLQRHLEGSRCVDLSLQLDLRSKMSQQMKRLRLEFRNVRELRLGNMEYLQECVVCIANIKQDQLEGLFYRVSEVEDQIRFCCRDFTMVIEDVSY